jgi:hypothetical protein
LARSPNQAERRGHTSKAQSDAGLGAVIRDTTRLWRRHGLGFDQTKYVVEHVRRELDLAPPTPRSTYPTYLPTYLPSGCTITSGKHPAHRSACLPKLRLPIYSYLPLGPLGRRGSTWSAAGSPS